MITKKGRGRHGDQEGHRKAGSLGGQATARNHGSEFYAKIGRTGGKSKVPKGFATDPAKASAAGKLSGQARAKGKR